MFDDSDSDSDDGGRTTGPVVAGTGPGGHGSGRCYLAHDLGTGGDKAVLVDVAGRVLGSAFEPYPLHHPHPHWAEQDPDDWWAGVVRATRRVLDEAGVPPEAVAGIGFAGQMLALAPLDRSARPTRPAISWLDARADDEARRITRRSGGRRVVLAVAGAVPSGKDIICKLAWIRRHEPDVWRRTAAFCDATGYLVARCTGELLMDHTAGGGTGIVSRRTRGWSRSLALLTGTPLGKLPPLRASTEVAGRLLEAAADELGLRPGTPVIVGMGDVPAAALGSGAVGDGETHVCLATSGWVCTTVRTPRDIGRHGIVSLASADPGHFVMIGEMETAGACLTWFAEAIGPGEGTVPPPGSAPQAGSPSVYQRIDALAEQAPPGSGGLLFLPWMFGERAPVTDTDLRGAFVGLSLDHGRAHLARAVLEGVAHNLRWTLDVVGDHGYRTETVRVIGGGARSDTWLQILADVTGRRLERVADPQEAGAVGCALAVAVALGDLPSVQAIGDVVRVDRVFVPGDGHRAAYDRDHAVFRSLQPPLARVGRALRVDPDA